MNGKELLSLYAKGLTWKEGGSRSYADLIGIGENIVQGIVRAAESQFSRMNFELGIDRPIPFLLIPPTPKIFSLQHESLGSVRIGGRNIRVDCGQRPEAKNLIGVPTHAYFLLDVEHQLRFKEETYKEDEKNERKVRRVRPDKRSHADDLKKSDARDLTLYEVLWLCIFFPTLLDYARVEAGATKITIDYPPKKKPVVIADEKKEGLIEDDPEPKTAPSDFFPGLRFGNEPIEDPTVEAAEEIYIAIISRSPDSNPTIGRTAADTRFLDAGMIPAVSNPSIRPFANKKILSVN